MLYGLCTYVTNKKNRHDLHELYTIHLVAQSLRSLLLCSLIILAAFSFSPSFGAQDPPSPHLQSSHLLHFITGIGRARIGGGLGHSLHSASPGELGIEELVLDEVLKENIKVSGDLFFTSLIQMESSSGVCERLFHRMRPTRHRAWQVEPET